MKITRMIYYSLAVLVIFDFYNLNQNDYLLLFANQGNRFD